MCEFNPKNDGRRIDKCMNWLIHFVNHSSKFRTVASCCGHKKYPPTLIVTHPSYDEDVKLEVFSNKIIRRKKKFYVKDKQGYFYIPECVNK